MDPAPSPQPPDSPAPPSLRSDAEKPPLEGRVIAFIEILICSDFLTQFALGGTLAALGYRPFVEGRLNVGYVVALSLGDAILLVGLILLMLYAHGESARQVLFGHRRIVPEMTLGVPMMFLALGVAAVVLVTIRRFAPGLHTVPDNPLQELLRSPRDAWLFALVVFVAGGLREEIQRAFLLHRFEVWLGGPLVGIVVTSVAFGAGHLLQGVDAALATGLLGAFWGIIYLRRRSCMAPIVSHSGFDLIQILQFLVPPR